MQPYVRLTTSRAAASPTPLFASPQLAAKHKSTKFLRIAAQSCIEGYPDRNVPTVFVYRDGAVQANIIGLGEFGGLRATEESEWRQYMQGADRSTATNALRLAELALCLIFFLSTTATHRSHVYIAAAAHAWSTRITFVVTSRPPDAPTPVPRPSV